MIVTELQAFQRWCPHARIIEHTEDGGVVPPSNRTILSNQTSGSWDNPDDSPCIGSRCMAWRWWGWRTKYGSETQIEPAPDSGAEEIGYCGLAGKP